MIKSMSVLTHPIYKTHMSYFVFGANDFVLSRFTEFCIVVIKREPVNHKPQLLTTKQSFII